ncbi:MAG: FAD-dependent oxidoreductase, partial [Acidobacteriaceae bacterium]|nr:FAD-dependent oxidoreductase [Acidobacteriaceae bacterium]
QFAPGLKTLADAVLIRSKILRAFEQAEAEEDPTRQRDLLTFVLVGAGSTGVELAGAIAVLVRKSLKSEFRRIDPASARIVLVDKSERVLPAFFKTLSSAARARLEQLGVEVRLNCSVDSIDEDGVVIAGKRISSRTVIWTAGTTPSPAAKWLNAESDTAGRVLVKSDLSVPGYPDIFVVGDTACCYQDGKPLPSVAHVAIQQGQYVGKLIEARLTNGLAPGRFSYFDKGNMAVIGKGFAVLQSGDFYISGASAWLTWAAVHLECLMRSSVRFSVFVQWLWTYLTGQRGSGLIIDQHGAQRPTAESDLPPGVKAA